MKVSEADPLNRAMRDLLRAVGVEYVRVLDSEQATRHWFNREYGLTSKASGPDTIGRRFSNLALVRCFACRHELVTNRSSSWRGRPTTHTWGHIAEADYLREAARLEDLGEQLRGALP